MDAATPPKKSQDSQEHHTMRPTSDSKREFKREVKEQSSTFIKLINQPYNLIWGGIYSPPPNEIHGHN